MTAAERAIFIRAMAAGLMAKGDEEGLSVKASYAVAQATLYVEGVTGGVIGDMTLQVADIMREGLEESTRTVDMARDFNV